MPSKAYISQVVQVNKAPSALFPWGLQLQRSQSSPVNSDPALISDGLPEGRQFQKVSVLHDTSSFALLVWMTFRGMLCGKCRIWGYSLLSLLGVIGSSAVSLNSGHSQQHGKPTQADSLHEEKKAFKNSSEKQISNVLLFFWCWVLFFLLYKISMSKPVMKTIHFLPIIQI